MLCSLPHVSWAQQHDPCTYSAVQYSTVLGREERSDEMARMGVLEVLGVLGVCSDCTG